MGTILYAFGDFELDAALMAGEFLLYGGDVYSADEARQWLTASGWRHVEHLPLAGPVSLLVAEAAVS